ncbi:cytochrome c [uncultured Maribacter sp.]|uniref:c-type cytochrome n=1 Tax=uncultured Maribacter sp. TaxID=431308 RepID=UPI00260636D5|nr:cytochrome c [uncultured Maribacter sp.]
MKKIASILALGVLLASCGEKKEEKKDGFEINRTKTETKAVNPETKEVPVDLSNKGVGPITTLELNADIDAKMATAGEEKFKALCTACHMVDKRMIGPALKGVTKRRSPEWIMNMIINPDKMIKEDPIAKALLKEYNNAIMFNQNLSEEDARSILEYLRTL